ncbi:tyrosine-protein phosphatase [Desulfovibrio sp. DV]|uniref:tyrosine-protein phosphatase n=1 Tax=Desulfovibrio sp. DV TaxID=1844708 RepID=UPI0009FB534F|nr:tyrosine-protein phosphatase [Desulfovibrio sp. DV]
MSLCTMLVGVRRVLCTLALGACLPWATASAQQAIGTPILTTAENFRDIAGISASAGGTGFANLTSNFGVMRTGVFYRSNVLDLDSADWTTLSGLGIGRVIDLRTPAEISATPDVVPAGAVYTNINVIGTSSMPSMLPSSVSLASLLSVGQSGYQTFVTNPVEREGFRTVLLTLAHDTGPDLFHCSMGKDRTGWVAALLESIAGVSSTTLLNDYLASNTYLAGTIDAQAAALAAAVPELRGVDLTPLFGVNSGYLQAALDQVTASYGSMYGYLIQGLGLSLEDIYVLRGKMVNYAILPGQTVYSGNDASGAAFLNALQNSSLSGRYTAYNYYLQSSVDAGTLGGVQRQVGGQVHADAASYLLRQPRWIDAALAPYTDSRELVPGQARMWLAGMGSGFWSQGRAGISPSTERSAGTLIGATSRLSDRGSASLGLGYTSGTVESAAATATVNTVMATLGGRYGFSSLEAGPYVVGRVDGGWVDYRSNRPLGGGLGAASGQANGALFSGLAGLGDVIAFSPVTLTPQAGVRVTSQTLGAFTESGSEAALGVHGLDNTAASLLLDLDAALEPQILGAWSLAPTATLRYERYLGNPQVASTGTRYGFAVSQKSAFDSHDLLTAGLGITARRHALSLEARGNVVVGDGAGSAGLGGQLSLGYSF